MVFTGIENNNYHKIGIPMYIPNLKKILRCFFGVGTGLLFYGLGRDTTLFNIVFFLFCCMYINEHDGHIRKCKYIIGI